MPEIDIILYHGGPLKNANANKGLPFEGPGIKTYYTQIDRRLKTLDELKKIVMEELCENPTVHNIQITYHMPNEILKHQINYKYMAIVTDKHVKIMFDKLERIVEVTNIELYIQLEPRAVWQEDIQQTTTSLQVTVPDNQYKKRMMMFMPMVMMMTTMLMRLLPLTMMTTTLLKRILLLTVKILSIKMSMKT